jgi:hypothetical protein
MTPQEPAVDCDSAREILQLTNGNDEQVAGNDEQDIDNQVDRTLLRLTNDDDDGGSTEEAKKFASLGAKENLALVPICIDKQHLSTTGQPERRVSLKSDRASTKAGSIGRETEIPHPATVTIVDRLPSSPSPQKSKKAKHLKAPANVETSPSVIEIDVEPGAKVDPHPINTAQEGSKEEKAAEASEVPPMSPAITDQPNVESFFTTPPPPPPSPPPSPPTPPPKPVPVVLTEERRKKCYMWYARLGQPNRETMKRKVAALPDSCDITIEEVNALPWVGGGMCLSVKAMNELFLNPEDAE